MAVFMCRWPDGNVSFVSALNKKEARERLDEVGWCDLAHLTRLPEFQVHFRLQRLDNGPRDWRSEPPLELQEFGEGTQDALNAAYPLLDRFLDRAYGEMKADASAETITRLDAEYVAVIAAEVGRVESRPEPDPDDAEAVRHFAIFGE